VSLNVLVSSIPVFFVSALSVQIQNEMDFGNNLQGTVIASYFAAAAIAARFLGQIGDRLHPAFTVRLSLLFTLASCLGIPLLASSWQTLCLFMVLAGGGNGIVSPALARVIAQSVPLARQGLSFGIKQSSFVVATLFGGVAIPLLALTIGWQFAFFGAAVLAAVLLGLPKDFLIAQSKKKAHATEDSSQRPPKSVLRLLAVAFGLGMAAATALAAFAIAAMVTAGIGIASAGIYLALGSAGAICIRLTAGWLIDRGRIDHLLLVIILLGLAAVGLLALSFGGPGTTGVAVIAAYTFTWGWAGLGFYAVVDLHRYRPASASGIAQSAAASGAVLGPIIFGLIATNSSYQVGWIAAAGLTALAAFFVYRARSVNS